jgi:outer membrane protein TolC
MLLGVYASAGWAKEPSTPEISLNEAIALALKNSKDMKNAELDVEKSKEEKDHASDQLDYAPGGSADPETESAWYSLLSSDLSWQMSKKTKDATEDKLVLDICNKYWNIQKALENVSVQKLKVQETELALQRVQAMIRVGMVPSEYSGTGPQAALSGAEGQLAAARSSLTEMENELNTAYEAFNQKVGLWPEDRPVLSEEVDYEPLENVVIEAAVNRVLAESPSVWLAEEQIDLAKFATEMAYATGGYSPYKVRQIGEEQAEIDALSAKDAVKLATRNIYYSVVNLEAGRAAAEKELDRARESLRVAELSYDLGMITKEKLMNSKVTLVTAEQTLKNLTLQHAYLKMGFQKPWAVSTS